MWRKIISGVLKDSILGPLLFNIFINDICLFAKNSTLGNYADDNTEYFCEKAFDEVTRDAFPAAKICKEGSRKIFNK